MENLESDQLIHKIITWIESSTDFMKGQLPDFIDQYMKAALINSWIDLFVLLTLFIFFSCISIYAYKRFQSNDEKLESSFFGLILSVFCPLVTIVSFILLINEINQLVYIYIAPKAYVLYHIKDFLK